MEEILNNIKQTRCQVSKSKIIIEGHTNQLELLEEKTDLVGAREMEIKSNMRKTITIETTTRQF